jgi:DNA-binding CsgD family transcriptional regulator
MMRQTKKHGDNSAADGCGPFSSRLFPGQLSELTFAEGSRWPASADIPAPVCPECGALRVAHPSFVRGVIATLPEEVVAALALIPTLMPRERATLDLLGHGHDNRSIARTLGISERTAKRHVSAILSKLALESRLQAGLIALIMSSCLPAGASRPEGRMDPPLDDR